MKFRFLLLALLVTPAGWAISTANLEQAQLHYRQGNELMDKGNVAGAMAEYRRAIRMDPGYAEAHASLATALQKKGDLSGANREDHEARRLNKKEADDHFKRAGELEDKNDYDGAIAECRTAIRLDPDDPSGHKELSSLLSQKGDWDGAIAELVEAGRLIKASGKTDDLLDAEIEALKFKKSQDKPSQEPVTAEPPAPGHKSSGEIKIIVYSLLGFIAGLYCFIKGFWIYRELRVFEDTPKVPIRSIAMGLTHIHGNSEGEQTVPAPVSKWPCYFYEVCIERWETDSKGGGHWTECSTDADGVRFYIADATGKVLVDAHGAECELNQSGMREIGAGGSLLGLGDSSFSTLSVLNLSDSPPVTTTHSVTDDDLRSYLNKVVPGSSRGRHRLTEFTILPNRSYDVIGTCLENPQATGDHDRSLITKGQNEKTFLITWRTEKDEEHALRKKAALYIFGGAGLAVVCLAIFLAMIGWI